MTSYFFRRETCRACNSKNVQMVVPLAPLPITSPNIGLTASQKHDVNMRQTVPLDLYRCDDCGLLQLLSVIDPGIQYNNFLYVTAISLGLTEHFGQMANDVSRFVRDPSAARVVEIGSNDGTLLRFFKDRGMQVLGIDPARATAEAATKAGITTLPEFFTSAMAERIRREFGPADIVIANNTLANIDDLADVAKGIKTLLAPGGVFVFETSYGADVVRKTLLDTIYHEHISYFMAQPLRSYFARHGLELFDIEQIWTKGGSIRGYVQHAGGPHPLKPSVAAMVTAEAADRLDRRGPYDDMAKALAALKADIGKIVAEHTARRGQVAAYGASVGTITLIQQFDLGPILTAVYDDKPLQEHILGPGYKIPVLRSDKIYDENPACILLLAWRYAEPIVKKHQAYLDRGGQFVVPLPKLDVIRKRP